MPDISSAHLNDLMRREVASPISSATFYLLSKPAPPNSVKDRRARLRRAASDFLQVLEVAMPDSVLPVATELGLIPKNCRALQILPLLKEKNYAEPFVLALEVRSRQQASLECAWLYQEITRNIADYTLRQTIDWWSRPLHDAGLGYLTIGFRACDMREMV